MPRAKDPHEHQRYPLGEGHKLLKKIEGGWISPVQVLEHGHDGLHPRQPLKGPTHGPKNPVPHLGRLEILYPLSLFAGKLDPQHGGDEWRRFLDDVRQQLRQMLPYGVALLDVGLLPAKTEVRGEQAREGRVGRGHVVGHRPALVPTHRHFGGDAATRACPGLNGMDSSLRRQGVAQLRD